jgi:hypothetical protein
MHEKTTYLLRIVWNSLGIAFILLVGIIIYMFIRYTDSIYHWLIIALLSLAMVAIALSGLSQLLIPSTKLFNQPSPPWYARPIRVNHLNGWAFGLGLIIVSGSILGWMYSLHGKMFIGDGCCRTHDAMVVNLLVIFAAGALLFLSSVIRRAREGRTWFGF